MSLSNRNFSYIAHKTYFKIMECGGRYGLIVNRDDEVNIGPFYLSFLDKFSSFEDMFMGRLLVV